MLDGVAHSPETHPVPSIVRLLRCLFAAGLLVILLAAIRAGGFTAAQGDPPALFSTPTPLPDLAGPLLGGTAPDDAGLFLYDIGTGRQRDLVLGPGIHGFGDFAPDGCRFVFLLGDANGRNIRLYSARLDGSDIRPLIVFTDTMGAITWDAWAPDWSPDGAQIAFVLLREYEQEGRRTRTAHIAVIPAEGGTPTIYSVSGTEGAPAWSPDGNWLVYTSYELNPGGERENDLWLISADGGTKLQLTSFASGSTLFPRWSPDGQVISFIYAPSGNNHQFWTTPASGGAVQQWSNTWAMVLDYAWLPDGSGLVAAIKNWQGQDDNRLWRVPLPGFADTDATLYLDNPEVTAADYPRFSPDGRYLAFRSAYSVMIADTTSGEVRLVPGAGLSNSPLVWSPAAFPGEGACPP